MPAGTVPDRGDAVEVQRCDEIGQKVDSGGHIGKRLRPAAAVSDPPVLEIPGHDIVPSQVLAERRHQRAVIARLPEAAVDDDDDPVRPGLVWKKQLAVLARVVSVAVPRGLDGASVACSERKGS